jgi:ATP-dependent DNA ligase
MLAKPVDGLPSDDGWLFEPKWDGFRAIVFRGGDSDLYLQSRDSRPFDRYFPELRQALLERLPEHCVVDGEIVVVTPHGLDFDALQQRLHPAASRVEKLARETPASFVAFDLLAAGGRDLRGERWRERRAALDELAGRWAPPLQLSPVTSDPEEARGWFHDYRPAGVEGLVAKGAGTRYAPGRREWLKVKSWETTEVLAGGVIGPIERPSQLVAGRYRDGELVVVGRTSPLSPRQSAELAAVLAPAGDDHPWPDRIGTGRFGGGRLSVPLTRVEPAVVVEVSADAALQAGVFRHPLRFVRVRPDLEPGDLPPVP